MSLPNTPTCKALAPLADQSSAIAMADSDAPPGFPQLPAGDSTALGSALLLLAAVVSIAQEIIQLLLRWHYQMAVGSGHLRPSTGCHSCCQACQHAHAFTTHDQRGSPAHWRHSFCLPKLLR